MRVIGQVTTESAARTFSDYLIVQGIANRLERAEGAQWTVWVEDEDRLKEAGDLLGRFMKDPAAPEFRDAAKGAAATRDASEKEKETYRQRLKNRRDLFKPLTGYGFGPLTFLLIAISVVVFFVSRFGSAHEPIMGLYITRFWEDATTIRWLPNLYEVRHGQVWRLITPVFIHMDVLHILFNMLWLRDLGSMIEGRQGSTVLLLLVLVSAVLSNIAQFYLGPAPNFGGMSGVVYGLLGYVWLRGKFDPASGLFLHPTTVTMMLVWFFACLFHIIPNIANWAHAGGLAVGMAWGYLSAIRAPLNR